MAKNNEVVGGGTQLFDESTKLINRFHSVNQLDYQKT